MSHSIRTQHQRGGTILGFIVGLVIGLAIALAVALAITKGPMPFVNKVTKAAATPDDDGTGKLPDPNKALYGKDAPVLTAPSAPSTPSAPVVVASPALTSPTPTAPSAPAAAPGSGSAGRTDLPNGKVNFLQAGAFKTSADADNMKAKLALLGFEAQTSATTVNAETLYRVRLGPYGRIDDLNRVRQRLVENGIDAALVPQ